MTTTIGTAATKLPRRLPTQRGRAASHRASSPPRASNTSKPVEKPALTVLFYMDGSNDLEPFVTQSLVDLEKLGSTREVNLVAQLGRLPQSELKKAWQKRGRHFEPTDIDGDWSGVRRYHVTAAPKDGDPQKRIHSKAVERFDDLDMSKPTTLADFLVWGMRAYPAQNYLVVLMDHGGGWNGAFTDDASARGDRIMSPDGIAAALRMAHTASGQKPHVVDMAACLMASAEVAHEMKDDAGFLVGSEEMGTIAAFKYNPIVNALQRFARLGKALKPQQIADFLVHYYDKDNTDAYVTRSAIDLSKVAPVKEAVNRLAETLLATKTKPDVLRAAMSRAQNFGRTETVDGPDQVRDLYDLAKQFSTDTDIKDARVKGAAKDVMKAVQRAVVANEAHEYERVDVIDEGLSIDGKEKVKTLKISTGRFDTHGLSILAPTSDLATDDDVMARYGQLRFAKDNKWPLFLQKLASIASETT